jgi:hypothetical protein
LWRREGQWDEREGDTRRERYKQKERMDEKGQKK